MQIDGLKNVNDMVDWTTLVNYNIKLNQGCSAAWKHYGDAHHLRAALAPANIGLMLMFVLCIYFIY